MIFDVLLSPLSAFFESECPNIDKKSGSKKLFFEGFCRDIFFAVFTGVRSLRELSNELYNNDLCKKIGLSPTPFSTLKDGFSRFGACFFKQLYEHALRCHDWAKIKSFEELGTLRVVDGSLFPALIQMSWAKYKSGSAACKLHLCFELNRMIPVNFFVGSGNSPERDFLVSIIEESVTYIADRGYFSFAVAEKMVLKKAFFLFRIKSNMIFAVSGGHGAVSGVPFPACFSGVSDHIIRFSNDGSGNEYRLVRFTVGQKHFHICTNRLDLTTLQVMMLYSFRWQVELMFKFLKRTAHGLHLFSNGENGAQAHFYLWLTAALMELRIKQSCVLLKEASPSGIGFFLKETENIEHLVFSFSGSCDVFVKHISKMLYFAWKLSKNFLLLLKNSIAKEADLVLLFKFADA